MLNKFLHINDFNYYIEFDDGQDYAQSHKVEYIMLRNFSIMNNVVCDNHLYFIEKELFTKLQNQLKNKEQINCICFPSNANHYSDHYTNFNDLFTDADITKNLSVYELYNNEISEDEKPTVKKIKQNLIKIYHPHIKTKNNYIVHINNVINNIKVHYICNLYNNFVIKSCEEIRKQNNIYSEYIEVPIPDIRDLFGMDIRNNEIVYSTYYKEDLNIVDKTSENNEQFLSEILKYSADEYGNYFQYVPLALLTQPFLLQEEEDSETHIKNFKKLYFKHNLSVSNNYMITPINVVLFPYEYLDEINHLYIIDSELNPGSVSINYEYKFKISTTCDFDNNGRISFLTRFNYPDKKLFDNIYGEINSLSEAYCYFNGIIDKSMYNKGYDKLYEQYKNELDEITCLTSVPEYNKKILISQNAKCLTMNDSELLEEFKKARMTSFLEEYIDEYKTDIDFFGFRIEIGTDVHFKNIIFTQNQSLSIEFLTKLQLANIMDIKNISFEKCLNTHVFTFNIDGLFTNWLQMPETLIAKVYFIDRFTGFVIESNPIIINKENFKYIINENAKYRLNTLTKYNNDKYNEDMKEYIVDKDAFNFLNNINCIIHDDTEENIVVIDTIKDILKSTEFEDDSAKIEAINTIIKERQQTKITKSNQINNLVYQPIFYATQQLDNINIKRNLTQNIGLDLHEYVAVVDLFVLYLDDKKYTEIGRNNNYVVFNINALKLNSTSGEYYIYNKDNEYISSGNWTII